MNSNKGHSYNYKNQKTSNQKPDPSRFEMYSVLPDKTGFKILGSEHIFYFDIYGGWFDEYGNYYDADAVPRTPPTYSDEEEYDDIEKLAAEYEDVDYEDLEDKDSEEKNLEDLKDYEEIYTHTENKKVVEANIPEIEIEFEVKNINYHATEEDFEKFLEENGYKWINLEFEYDHRNRFTGYAFILFDKPEAQKFVTLNGKYFQGRPLRIFALKPELLKEPEEIFDDDDDDDEDDDEESEDEGTKYEGEEPSNGEKGPSEGENKEEEHKTSDDK